MSSKDAANWSILAPLELSISFMSFATFFESFNLHSTLVFLLKQNISSKHPSIDAVYLIIRFNICLMKMFIDLIYPFNPSVFHQSTPCYVRAQLAVSLNEDRSGLSELCPFVESLQLWAPVGLWAIDLRLSELCPFVESLQ